MRGISPVCWLSRLDALCDGVRGAAVAWLLLVGLWSGPTPGATLIYRWNALPVVEVLCALVLLYQGRRGRVWSPRAYPFLWPCLAVLLLSAGVGLLRLHGDGVPFNALRLWQHGEPMARGLLLFLAIAGQPRLKRAACVSLFAGIAVLAAACIIQHCTHVTRWYTDLDRGWADGFHPLSGVRTDGSAGYRVQGLTSYINLTAAMLAAALPCWLLPLLLHRPAERRLRVLLLAGGLATAAALWYTDSRGPMVALALVGCLFLWRLSRRWALYALLTLSAFLLVEWVGRPVPALLACLLGVLLLSLPRVRQLRVLLALALGLALAGGQQTLDAYVLHLPLQHGRVLDKGLTDSARLEANHVSWRIVRAHPWCGVGDAELCRRLFKSTSFFSQLPHTQYNAHNQYLHWAATEGLPVALAFTLLLGWTVYRVLRRRAHWPSPFARALGLAAALGLTTFLLCNWVDAHFWRIEGGGFYWSLLATVVAFGETSEQ